MRLIRRLKRKWVARRVVRETRLVALSLGIDLSDKSDFAVLLLACRTCRWMCELGQAIAVTVEDAVNAFAELGKALASVDYYGGYEVTTA